MITRYISSFIDKVSNAKHANVKEIRLTMQEADGIVLELMKMITEENHLISFEDLKAILKNNANNNNNNSETKIKISGGSF